MRFIGSKTKLLDNINEVIEQNVKGAKTLCDIFSGTGAVSKYFKSKYRIINNDFLYFSYVIQRATIKNTSKPKFNLLNKYLGCDVFEFLHNIDLNENIVFDEEKYLIRNNYSSFCERNYLTEENALIIDKWRLCIEEWYQKN